MLETPIPRQKFYNAILEAYDDGKEMTARECSEALLPTGLTKFGLRHEVAPRITEMLTLGWMESCGSKFDCSTRKRVTVYRRKVS